MVKRPTLRSPLSESRVVYTRRHPCALRRLVLCHGRLDRWLQADASFLSMTNRCGCHSELAKNLLVGICTRIPFIPLSYRDELLGMPTRRFLLRRMGQRGR